MRTPNRDRAHKVLGKIRGNGLRVAVFFDSRTRVNPFAAVPESSDRYQMMVDRRPDALVGIYDYHAIADWIEEDLDVMEGRS